MVAVPVADFTCMPIPPQSASVQIIEQHGNEESGKIAVRLSADSHGSGGEIRKDYRGTNGNESGTFCASADVGYNIAVITTRAR
jgi:hypothetical protein